MLQKRLDYGFSGYQVPFIPKAARSARRRDPIRENVVDQKLCAFDLLATVAGELLEGESSQSAPMEKDWCGNIHDVVMEEQDEGSLSVKAKHCDKGNDVNTASVNLELGLEVHDRDHHVHEIPVLNNDTLSGPTSVITSSHCLEKDDSLVKMNVNNGKSEGCDPGHNDAFIPDVNEIMEQHDGKLDALSSDGPDVHHSQDFEFFDGKSPQIASSDCSIKLSLDGDRHPCGSLSPCGDHNNSNNNVKVVTRDDEENFSGYTQPRAKKAARMPARAGDRRIRNLLASKYWRVASKSKIKDGDMSDTEFRCIYRSRTGYKRQRSQRIYPFKKRKKFYHYSSLSNSDGDTGGKGVYDSPDREIDQTVSASYNAIRHGVDGSSSCVAGQSTAFASRESHVKLRIKSFRVPELFIEMPETATVGALKRTVMEALTALIGGGLRVGVLLQGKKIRDDNRTLGQFGMCHDDKLESLGFTLEPKATLAGIPVCSEDNSHMLSTDFHQPISRCPTSSADNEGASSHDQAVNNVGNLVESDHDSAPSAEFTAEKGTFDSLALVVLPDGTPEALAMGPANQKSKRSEMAQRRIRRPFSVSEVEALVQAVEKLGTGRWRDVKLRAFDNVKHRTYVDLKDKWKTLVHTARISPQQRRGEPVPQELLDRVLCAHSYWSEQQAKQQLKQPPPSDSCLLL